MKLSACLIVKNEKDHIRDVLSSIKGVDEIVVVDTGSTDNTVELAKEFTDLVFTDYTWNDDFAEARNHALSKCTGDWVLSIDADEVLEEGGVEKIRELIKNSEEEQAHFSVVMKAKWTGAIHYLPRIMNREKVKWVGVAHETLSPIQANKCDVTITYGYSTAHDLDPDRMLRILSKLVLNVKDPTARDLYYYARELFYRKKYEDAAHYFRKCTDKSTWLPEKTDALLYLSRCLFYLDRGNEARIYCKEAIVLNPDFKEALLFMAELHFEPWKHKWERLASIATNEDVLFIRV